MSFKVGDEIEMLANDKYALTVEGLRGWVKNKGHGEHYKVFFPSLGGQHFVICGAYMRLVEPHIIKEKPIPRMERRLIDA